MASKKMQTLLNPAKMKLGKGKAIKLANRTEGGRRVPESLVHIKSPRGNFALCGAGKAGGYKRKADRRKIEAVGGRNPVVTCYRCIKLYRMNQGHAEDQLLKFPSNKQIHHLIPGGREGRYISKSKPYTVKIRRERIEDGFGPFTVTKGAQYRGPASHPTQTRMLSASSKKARERRTGTRGTQLKLIANPRYFDLGYDKGRKDFRSTSPTPASTLKQRSMSYQRGYLEGYADAADKKAARANPKKRKNPSPVGKAQKAIVAYLKQEPNGIELHDLGRVRALRGVHFGQIMRSVDALEKKGLIRVKGTMIFPATRKNTRKRSNPHCKPNPHCKRVNTPNGYRYMVNGKFATKAKYDRAKKRRR